jgi:hypothetical protein
LITKTKGDPFFFPALKGELFSDAQERLIAAIGWESSDGLSYRFLTDKSASESPIAAGIVLSEVGIEKSTLIVIRQEDSKPGTLVSPRSASPVVRIHN